MLEGGEDPVYIGRRLVRAAAEDIGKAEFGNHLLIAVFPFYQNLMCSTETKILAGTVCERSLTFDRCCTKKSTIFKLKNNNT